MPTSTLPKKITYRRTYSSILRRHFLTWGSDLYTSCVKNDTRLASFPSVLFKWEWLLLSRNISTEVGTVSMCSKHCWVNVEWMKWGFLSWCGRREKAFTGRHSIRVSTLDNQKIFKIHIKRTAKYDAKILDFNTWMLPLQFPVPALANLGLMQTRLDLSLLSACLCYSSRTGLSLLCCGRIVPSCLPCKLVLWGDKCTEISKGEGSS